MLCFVSALSRLSASELRPSEWSITCGTGSEIYVPLLGPDIFPVKVYFQRNLLSATIAGGRPSGKSAWNGTIND